MSPPLARGDVTGLVLCGGRGSRMGGVDKGLQHHAGRPLAWHALQRLAPQVGSVLVSANRNLDDYAALGAPVVTDAVAGYPGPLAGWLAALARCTTPCLATVPCDSPRFPADLVARLAEALQEEHADAAVAATFENGDLQQQPVFCLLRSSLLPSLRDYVEAGGRKVGRWVRDQRCAQVVFEDATAFFNVNTPADLQQLARG